MVGYGSVDIISSANAFTAASRRCVVHATLTVPLLNVPRCVVGAVTVL